MQMYVELLQKLIRLRPVSKDIEAVNKVENLIFETLKAHGVHCVMEETNGRKIVYASTVETKTPDLMLNAHVDVVPAATEDQFEPVIENGWIRGRGTADCLGSAVTMIKILCEAPKGVSIGAIFTSDEEIGGLTTKYMAQQGYVAKRIIAIMDHWEDGSICYAQKGIIAMTMTAHGKGGHASMPWAFDNPVDKLIAGYLRFKEAWGANPTADDQWHNSMAATVLNAGMVGNQIPDTASMKINIRFTKMEDEAKIIELAKQTSGLEITVAETCPPVFLDPDQPEFKILASAVEKYYGKYPEFKRMNGATDARWFAACGKPIAIFGVCGSGAHSSHEVMELASIEKHAMTMWELAKNL